MFCPVRQVAAPGSKFAISDCIMFCFDIHLCYVCVCVTMQINRAVAVLYARQLLMSLLADWPTTGHVITAELLDCSAVEHLPYVLDLLNRSQSPELFSKVFAVFLK